MWKNEIKCTVILKNETQNICTKWKAKILSKTAWKTEQKLNQKCQHDHLVAVSLTYNNMVLVTSEG